jgi:sulfhydrogenase subunit alpha
MMSEHSTIHINVPALARVEGEGALDLTIDNGAIEKLNLRIYEPPRYFEKFLEGRDYTDVIDIVARICGICPVAYQMSAAQALEAICNATPSAETLRLRRIMYCGEWIQSHSLHVHMLALPDFLGFDSILGMSGQYPEVVHRGLALQGIGNDLIRLLGGRSVHPVGVRVGGFHRIPKASERQALHARVKAALPQARELLEWTTTLQLPDDPQDFINVALRHETEYPMYSGRLVSSDGLDISIEEFEQHFVEHQAPHSTALHALLHGKPYLVGPLARLNLNHDRLPDEIRRTLERCNVQLPSRNMFHSLIARAVEIWLALYEAERLLAMDYDAAQDAPVTVTAGAGVGCTEAPRGILWHRYSMDADGLIRSARIVPPTSQNQPRIEQDIYNALTRFGLDKSADDIRLHAETVIRNYDPCISCATHFLKLNLERESTSDKCIANANIASTPVVQKTERLLVLGIGSEQPGDDIGLKITEQLRADCAFADIPKQRLLFHSSSQPAVDWPLLLRVTDRVLLVDALPGDSPDEPLVALHTGDLAAPGISVSSHALSPLELLRQAGIAMDNIKILGITATTAQQEAVLKQIRQTIINELTEDKS